MERSEFRVDPSATSVHGTASPRHTHAHSNAPSVHGPAPAHRQVGWQVGKGWEGGLVPTLGHGDPAWIPTLPGKREEVEVHWWQAVPGNGVTSTVQKPANRPLKLSTPSFKRPEGENTPSLCFFCFKFLENYEKKYILTAYLTIIHCIVHSFIPQTIKLWHRLCHLLPRENKNTLVFLKMQPDLQTVFQTCPKKEAQNKVTLNLIIQLDWLWTCTAASVALHHLPLSISSAHRTIAGCRGWAPSAQRPRASTRSG